MQVAANKIKEERNKIIWRIVKKDRKHILSLIEGVGASIQWKTLP
jgi:hypothetical protein